MTEPFPQAPPSLETLIQQYPEWSLQSGKLHRLYVFESFAAAFAFMQNIARLAEHLNHHPEWKNVYNRVWVDLFTHDAGDITAKDIELAVLMEQAFLAAQASAEQVPLNKRLVLQWPVLRVLPLMLGRPLTKLKPGAQPLEVLWLVVLLMLAARIAGDWLLALPPRYWSNWGFVPFFYESTLFGCFGYLLTRYRHFSYPPWLTMSLLFEVLLLFSLVSLMLEWAVTGHEGSVPVQSVPAQIAGGCYVFWLLAVMGLLCQQLLPGHKKMALVYLLMFCAVVLAPSYWLNYPNYNFWYHDTSADNRNERYPPIVDFEKVFFTQEAMVDLAINRLTPEIAGEIDLFYLGFGSYAKQKVFKKEVEYLNRLAETQNPGKKRSVMLINHRETIDTVPLAIHHNLRRSLAGLAQGMNRNEDVLFMYLTSHGSKEHELSIEFPGFRFVDMTPKMLRSALDEAGIRWRVLVISACYSGGFIEPLKNDDTVIITAADADSTSFGCDDANDFTYFGEALLRDQLMAGVPMLEAFPRAIEAIKARELAEDKEPSNSQLWVGPAIAEHMRRYQDQMEQQAVEDIVDE